MEEIAQEALVSRATAYRYFPNVESLLVEAPLDAKVPEPAELFHSARTDDPVARVLRVDALLAIRALIEAAMEPAAGS